MFNATRSYPKSLQQNPKLVIEKFAIEPLHLARKVMVIDGIQTDDFDFVDMGRVRLPSHTAPVTMKSLIFRGYQG